MKLLLDENLSRRLLPLLTDVFPGSQHVVVEGLAEASDLEVFRFAGTRGLVLVTQDRDFVELIALHGPPPKVVWLRLHNAPTSRTAAVLRGHRQDIERLAADVTSALLIINDRPS